MVQHLTQPASATPAARPEAPRIPTVAVDDGWAYFQGQIVPMGEARVSVATHGLNYGTGCFEGIRAYWNADQQQLHVLKLREHFERFSRSRRMLKMAEEETIDDLCAITLDLLRRQRFRQDVYIRPLAYKASRTIKLTLSTLEDAVTIFAFPMGNYVDISAGLSVCVSSWRRVSGNALPVRAKTTGAYVNSSLAIDDAAAAGFDEAIFLTEGGHVSEGSSCNLFLVRRGQISTPGSAFDILEGITRECVMELAERELGLRTVQRAVERTELYDADEVFFTGTGVQISPVTRIDGRPIGSGVPG
ncbi:MAG TPA: branched-chain amino acid transaminase, partial [Ktedonobacterales bacterium]|nr:branched-chain amino acid transaminase [Ktedonobacterales bacterium]